MPQPTYTDVHVNRPLTNISTAYIQRASEFVADRVFPRVPVQKASDLYFTYDKEFWFRSEVQLRAPSTESAGGGFEVGTASYRCDKFAIHKDLDDEIKANADEPLAVERDATTWVTQQLLLKRDLDWASTFFTTGVWTGGISADIDLNGHGTYDQFNEASTGLGPIEFCMNTSVAMAKTTGYRPNTMVVGPEVHAGIINNADIIERVKYTQAGFLSEDLIARALGFDRYIVAWAIKNTANEGAAETMNFVLGKSALICYSPPSPSLMSPAAGYTFTWNGLLGASSFGNRIRKFRMDHLNSDRIEGEMAYDMKVVSADCGAFVQNAVS